MSEQSQQTAIVKSEPECSLMPMAEVKYRMTAVEELMKEVMKKGPSGDYGVIPGTGTKPTLLKSGAEKLCTLFRLSPTYSRDTIDMGHGHREYHITCTLTHIPTNTVWGQGLASCSTMESKYRWRKAERTCPKCGAAAIKTSKFAPRGAASNAPPGFYCYAKIGGCGAEFAANDPAIVGQEAGRTENPDIADVYNTVLKMATKRGLVAAVLIATGASALFTQDIEDGASPDADAPAKAEGELLASETQVSELMDLMEAAQTPPATAQVWLKKAGVAQFEQMTAETIQKCIDHLKKPANTAAA